MFHTITKSLKWISLPALLVASVLSFYAANYQLAVNALVCLGAVILVYGSVRSEEYYWAAASVAVAVVFSPLLLVVKIFLLMGLVCVVTLASVVAAFLPLPVACLPDLRTLRSYRS